MFAQNMSTIALAFTVLSGGLLVYMLVQMIDEISININKKLQKSEEEKKTMKNALEILKEENDELFDKIYQSELTIDNLYSEINRIQPESELLDENERLVKICEKLHKKVDKLKKELKNRDHQKENKYF